jgi:predicted ATPase/DNA-binding CsgD family transcriptional regulator
VAVRVENVRGLGGLLRAVAGVVGVPPSWAPLPERLAAALAQEPRVLVLDGCDRMRGHPHPVASLLDLFPSLRIVATSLSPLEVVGEHVVGLDPLPTPSVAAGPDELRDSPAVRLFCRRAAEVDHGFEPGDADLAAIGELCRRVHGLPLGIEIVAARAGAESPGAMVELLDSGQEITLPSTGTVADPRHVSLEAALEWSYSMLEPDAARLLRRMAVFAGPATLDMLAAVAVVVPDEGPGPRPSYANTLDAVSALVDHRLVNLGEGIGEPGFMLVALVRDYALKRLVEEGELARTEEAYTRAVIEFALTRRHAVEGADDDIAQQELARSEADLRATLRRLVGRGDVEDGLLLASALAPFVLRRGYDGFVRPALTSLLRHGGEGELEDALVARATLWKARLVAQFDGPEAADEVRALFDEGMYLARRSGDGRTILLGLSFVMRTLPVTRDFAGASAAAVEGLPLAEAVRDERWVARFCAWAGIVANQTGKVTDALELARRGVEHAEACGDSRAEMLLAMLLAGLPTEEVSDLMSRLSPVDELLATARRLNDYRYEPNLLRLAAGLALREGDLRTAAARCADCLRLAQRQATWHDLPYGMLLLTLVAARRRDFEEAARFFGMVRAQVDLLRPGLPPSWSDDFRLGVETTRRALGDPAFQAFADQGEEERRANAIAGPLAYADSVAARTRRSGPVVPQPRPHDPDELTPREREVLEELVTGATNKEISHRLGMAPKTVMHHSVAIYRKLGVRGRAEATAWAFRHGIAS